MVTFAHLTEYALRLPLGGARAAPLICFVHVPKTAGTTVNRHLRQWSWRGVAHVERCFANPEAQPALIGNCRWVSGHTPLNRFLAALDICAPERARRFFALMRAPTDQIISHYNWQIEIYRRGEAFYRAHPQSAQEASRRVRETDHTSPAAVIKTLEGLPQLFANLQSRYILGGDVTAFGDQALTRLSGYEAVMRSADVDRLVEVMTGRRPRVERRENRSRDHFDRAVFSHPELRDFLKEFNSLDAALYARLASP